MSIPSIPGYLGPKKSTLAELWGRPEGAFPDELWPLGVLESVTQNPSDWLTIDEHFHVDDEFGGSGCVLVRADQAGEALKECMWIGRHLGEVSIFDSGRIEDGLATIEDGVSVEFFVKVRAPIGTRLPVLDVSHSFLWYWDAYPVDDGWKYVNHAGREQDLLRWSKAEESWRVEVRVLEFRHFLATFNRSAIIQLDRTVVRPDATFDRIDDEFRSDWAHFNFCALNDSLVSGQTVSSQVIGQYLLAGMRTSKSPRYEERRQDREYPDFIYGVDDQTGELQQHTCDPSALGTYFDKEAGRLHYLTPVYFKREVLQPYVAEPSRYTVSSHEVSCLGLWRISISFNTAGLVEVYLGDLGRDLPSDEWGHWRSYNVPPEGEMEQGRFRRDFLNQWASSPDRVGDLRRARAKVANQSEMQLGKPIWKPLQGEVASEFQSLVGPLNDDPVSLNGPLLVLTKVLIDGIDSRLLKRHLSTFEKDEKSLRLLERYIEQLGGNVEIIQILRQLQNFRSQGGIAHLAGSGKPKAVLELGIAGMSNLEAFDSVVERATSCLVSIAELLGGAEAAEGDPQAVDR